MKRLCQTGQFTRDVKRMKRRGKDLEKLKVVVRKLAEGGPLEPKYRAHPLAGRWRNSRDCHIEPDWVLIYTMDGTSLRLERTETHGDLFE